MRINGLFMYVRARNMISTCAQHGTCVRSTFHLKTKSPCSRCVWNTLGTRALSCSMIYFVNSEWISL